MSFTKESQWKLMASLMSDGFFILQDSHLTYVNPAFEQLLGASPGQLLGLNFARFVHPEMRAMVVSRHKDRLNGVAVPRHYEISLLSFDGKTRIEAWVEIETQEDEGRRKTVAGTVRDIGSYKSLKAELAGARQQIDSILDNMSDTVYQVDMNGEITWISSGVESLLGFMPEDMLGNKMADYYWSPAEREKVVSAIINNNGVVTNVEAILRRKDGSPVWISTNAYVKNNEQGEAQSIEGIARNVTVQKELEQKLERLALTDSLTNLPNRRALMDELHQRFVDTKKRNMALSLIFFDVNRFKQVNDLYGHIAGDKLLMHIAETLNSYVTKGSMFGRLSGDEFLFILSSNDAEQALRFAQSIIEEITHKSLRLECVEIPISLSFGVSTLKPGDKNEYSLLDRADKAMYLAKRNDRPIEVL